MSGCRAARPVCEGCPLSSSSAPANAPNLLPCSAQKTCSESLVPPTRSPVPPTLPDDCPTSPASSTPHPLISRLSTTAKQPCRTARASSSSRVSYRFTSRRAWMPASRAVPSKKEELIKADSRSSSLLAGPLCVVHCCDGADEQATPTPSWPRWLRRGEPSRSRLPKGVRAGTVWKRAQRARRRQSGSSRRRQWSDGRSKVADRLAGEVVVRTAGRGQSRSARRGRT